MGGLFLYKENYLLSVFTIAVAIAVVVRVAIAIAVFIAVFIARSGTSNKAIEYHTKRWHIRPGLHI